MARTPRERELVRRRQARRVGAAGLIAAAALPVLLWHRVIIDVFGPFRADARYLSGWVPWLLMACGVVLLVPVAFSMWVDPRSRLYPRGRNAYAGWGMTLYLLGFGLASQVASITLAG